MRVLGSNDDRAWRLVGVVGADDLIVRSNDVRVTAEAVDFYGRNGDLVARLFRGEIAGYIEWNPSVVTEEDVSNGQ